MQGVPTELYEAADVDGANGWAKFWRITLPLLVPSIFFQTIISTINAFQAFEFIYVLTRTAGGGSTVRLAAPRPRTGATRGAGGCGRTSAGVVRMCSSPS